jgi:hypothetical protein
MKMYMLFVYAFKKNFQKFLTRCCTLKSDVQATGKDSTQAQASFKSPLHAQPEAHTNPVEPQQNPPAALTSNGEGGEIEGEKRSYRDELRVQGDETSRSATQLFLSK